MKVAVLTTVYPRWQGDFFGNYICYVAQEHVRLGADVEVVAPHAARARTRERLDGIEVRRFRYALPASLQALAYRGGIFAELRRSLLAKLELPFFCLAFLIQSGGAVRRADVVHAHWTLAGVIGALLAAVFRKPLVLTVYGVEVHTGRFAALTRLCVRRARRVICISRATDEKLRELAGAQPEDKVSVIPYGTPEPPAPDSHIDVRGRHALAPDGALLLSVGRLVPRKGLDHLLRALPLLPEHARLIIAGDGPDRPSLERLAHKLDLTSRVTFAGPVTSSDLPSYYAACDVFVHPVVTDPTGDVEGLGIVLLEAMAHARPVVASGIGGITDVVVDGETGYLIPERDESALAARIHELLDDASLRERMGVAGRRRAVERFSVPALARRVLDVYEEALR